MDIAPRFRLPSSRLPLVTLAVAAALLTVLTGASNHPPSGGDGSRQSLAVGLAASEKPPKTTTTSVGGMRLPATAPTTTSPAVESVVGLGPAAAAGADGAGVADGAEDEQIDESEETEAEASDPAPTRTRASTPAPTSPPPPPEPVPVGLTRLPNVELEVLTLTNLDRGDNGVPPVTRDGCMDGEASAWAHAMAESNVMAHSGSGGPAVQGCRGASAAWGDNIGYWQPCYASEMEAWWMGSPSHRPHILDPSFSAVGIGVWAEPDGRCWFQVYFGT